METSDTASFTAQLSPVDGPMVHHVIHVPEEICSQFRQPKGSIRILCSIAGKPEFPCALNPRNSGYIIIASKALIKAHQLSPGTPFIVSIRKDVNDGLLMPEELEEVLEQDEWAGSLFDKLLPGHKRGLIYYVRTGQSAETRIKRAFEIAEKLKSGKIHSRKAE